MRMEPNHTGLFLPATRIDGKRRSRHGLQISHAAQQLSLNHTAVAIMLLGWVPALFAPVAAAAPPSQTPELQRSARLAAAVFAAKCVDCHGPDLARLDGHFGYVLDLHRLQNTPRLVVPFDAPGSKLWRMVNNGVMPPADATAGRLTLEQKHTIRQWIEVGAPDTAAAQSPVAASIASPILRMNHRSSPRALLRWLGQWHVVVVHFPIALLLTAAAVELWGAWRQFPRPQQATRVCVAVGVAGAVSAATLGWMQAAGAGFASTALFEAHRWIGTATGVCAVGIAVAGELAMRRPRWSKLFRGLLLIGALLVGIAGHLGGIIVHGTG